MGDELGLRDLLFVHTGPACLIVLALLVFGGMYRQFYKKRNDKPGLVINAE